MSLNTFQRFRFSPWFSQLVVIRRCNLSCTYCNEFDNSSEALDLELLKKRAKKLKQLGSFSINLTGGEPTLHPDLFELIRYCRQDLRFLRTTMITNGFYLTPELIKKLNQAGLQDMQISIDGVKPNKVTIKVLDTLRERLNYLKDHADFNVVVSGVVGSCPPEESVEVIRTAKDMGFKPRVLLLHDSDGQVKLSEEELAAYQEIKKMIPKSFPEFTSYQDEMLEKGSAPFKCRGGSRYLYVDEFGKVAWCSQTRHIFSKPLMDYTYQDLKREFYSYKSCQDQCTLGCVRSASSVDGWRNQVVPEQAAA
ncbi:MAG: radical SAM protein [Deltaproteobacteria bacterium]|nr:radical SAM protein [Deltaproteobacteria bacterium]